MKKIFSLLIIVACALATQAQTTINATVEQTVPQREWIVTLALDTDISDFAAMEFKTCHGMDEFTIESITALEALTNHTLSYVLTPAPPQAVNQEYFSHTVIYSASGAVFGTGNLLQINLRSVDDVLLSAGDNHIIDIYDIRLAHADGREDGVSDFHISIPSTPDGIANVSTSTSAAVYTLTGQRVGQPMRRGLYIIDGRKVMVR